MNRLKILANGLTGCQVDKRQIFDLASCRLIDWKHNAVSIGKPGVGKKHLAYAMGSRADGFYATIIRKWEHFNSKMPNGLRFCNKKNVSITPIGR